MEHPGLTMGKVMHISADLDGFRCTNYDSYSGIDRLKNSSNANPISGCVQSCCDYRQSEVAMGKARQKQLKTGASYVSTPGQCYARQTSKCTFFGAGKVCFYVFM